MNQAEGVPEYHFSGLYEGVSLVCKDSYLLYFELHYRSPSREDGILIINWLYVIYELLFG